jgi:hypothetical protein
LANLSTYKLSFVLAKSTGEPIGEAIRAATRTLQRRLNTPGVATVQLQLEDAMAAQILPGQSRLKIYRTPTAAELALNPAAPKVLLWYGSLPADGVTEETDSGLMTMAFQDPRWVLRQRFLAAPAAFTAQDQGLGILGSIITTQNTRQQTWLTPGGTTGILRDRTYDAGKNVADLIDEMTKVISGCDVDVVPADGYTTAGTRAMGSMNFYARQGTDRPTVLFYYQTRGGGNISGVKSTYAPILTSSTQQGTASDGTATAQTFTTATAYDLLEKYDTASDASVAATLLDKASGVVYENSSLRRIVDIGNPTWEAPLPFADYDLGDTVRLTAKRGTLSLDRASMRVMGYDLAADQEGNVSSRPILVAS